MAAILLVLQGILGRTRTNQRIEIWPNENTGDSRSDRLFEEVVRIPPRVPGCGEG
jgi:hypothetical protein